jgi:NhaA family Na+:H+ antiporter|tara:strand:+ start:160 stop:1422 length:1263 start_codon:yes stop_codon:yes gene_type:complete
MSGENNRRGALQFLLDNSAFLIGGAVVALAWANINKETYHEVMHAVIAGEGKHPVTPHFIINDILMAFFFAIAAKEVWEALLPGGPLSNMRKAATPLIATLGGMVGPAGLYLLGCYWLGTMDELGSGWAVPMATDIAFSYLIARLIFGPGHVAIPFLLLLAIADDAGGLLILAVFYPQGEMAPIWLLATAGAIIMGLLMRRMKLQSFWWYLLLPGTLSWFSFYESGLHPALGLVPIIPTLPHAHTDLGLFAREELGRHDTLNEFEHWWKNPVEIILGLFGLANAGVVFTSVGDGTWLVLAGLLIGKPLGVALFTLLGQKVLRLELPVGMSFRDLLVVGMVAGIGFTVALFVATAAFPADSPHLDSVKMGALGSFAAAFLAIVGARAMGIRPGSGTAEPPASTEAGKSEIEDDPGGAEDPS